MLSSSIIQPCASLRSPSRRDPCTHRVCCRFSSPRNIVFVFFFPFKVFVFCRLVRHFNESSPGLPRSLNKSPNSGKNTNLRPQPVPSEQHQQNRTRSSSKKEALGTESKRCAISNKGNKTLGTWSLRQILQSLSSSIFFFPFRWVGIIKLDRVTYRERERVRPSTWSGPHTFCSRPRRRVIFSDVWG